MARYRSKPSEIDAVQWTGTAESRAEMVVFAGDKVNVTTDRPEGLELLAGKDGAQEWVPVPIGHWLVMQPGDPSDIWPVENEYFTGKYEPVEGPRPTTAGATSIPTVSDGG